MPIFTIDFGKKLPGWVLPLFLGSCSFFAYLATLPKTISFEDSAEFVTTSASLGIAHPSGYPLYVVLGHLFTLLPFGTIPWRVALFSAVSAAAALVVLFIFARELVEATGERVDAATEMLMAAIFATFAFSPLWWSQAVYAKVYALHVLLLGAVALCLLRWIERKTGRDLFLVALFFGLACANHLFLTLVIGPWLLAALLASTWRKWHWKYPLLVVVGGVIGLLPYAYIVLRMPSAPYAAVTFSHPGQLLKFVMRSNYGDIGVGGSDKWQLFASLCRSAFEDLGAVPLLLAGIGSLFLVRRSAGPKVRAIALFCAGVLAASVLVVGLRAFGFSEETSYLYRVYGLPGEAFLAVLGAVGVGLTWRSAPLRKQKALRYVFAAILISMPFFSAKSAAPVVRVTTDPFVDRWLRQTLDSLPPKAVLVVAEEGQTSDTELFGLAYLQVVEGLRPDVTIAADMTIRPFYRLSLPEGESRFSIAMQRRMLVDAALNDASLKGRPLLTSFAPEAVTKKHLTRATGYAYAFDREAPFPELPHFLFPDEVRASYAATSIAAHLGYLEASRLNESGRSADALPILLRALDLDPSPGSGDYAGFMAHRAATAAVER